MSKDQVIEELTKMNVEFDKDASATVLKQLLKTEKEKMSEKDENADTDEAKSTNSESAEVKKDAEDAKESDESDNASNNADTDKSAEKTKTVKTKTKRVKKEVDKPCYSNIICKNNKFYIEDGTYYANVKLAAIANGKLQAKKK